jgi:hypothetical protein
LQQFVLLCVHYKPSNVNHGALIMNVLRVCGVATLLSLGAFIFLIGRDRRARRALLPAIHDADGPALRPYHRE